MDVEFLKYQFEDGCDGIVVKSRFKPGVRHVQVAYMFACACALGAMRGSVGVAVLAASDAARRNDTYIQIHEWDRRIQGTILSSFFFGYALMVLPAELLLKKVDGKLALTAALVVNGALAVAMPTIINKGGWIAACNAFLWMGMTQAYLSPATRALLARWLPPSERSLFSRLIHSGVHLGIIIGLAVSGIISEARLGWELVFYSQGMMALSMAAVWALLTAGTPERHPAVGDAEKEYIKEALSCYRKKVQRVPWRYILGSSQFWGVASAHAASNAVFVFYLVDVPAYLQTFSLSLRESAWRATLPLAALWAAHALTAPTLDWLGHVLQASFRFDITYYRKLLNAVGALGAAAGLAALALLPQLEAAGALVVLTGTLALLAVQFSGFLEMHKDMTQNYRGSLLALSSFVASVAGALLPALAGLALRDDEAGAGARWRVVLLGAGGAGATGAALLGALGGARARWDGGGALSGARKCGHYNAGIEATQLELEELSNTKSAQRKHDNDTGSVI